MGEPGSPIPPPAGGFGRAMPSSRGMGKPGFPIPSPGGRVWESYALKQGDGETRFLQTLTRWEGVGGRRPRAGLGGLCPQAGVWGNRVPPHPYLVGGWGRAPPAHRGVGQPGFPTLSPGGRVWAGTARGQGSGETGFSQTLTRWEGVGELCPQAGAWGNLVSPYSHPVGGCGRAQPVGRGLGKPGFPTPSPGRRV